jgi:hypothetical protein
LLSFFIERVGPNGNEREMVRYFILMVISFPNVLLYFSILSSSIVDLLVLYQFMCIFQLAILVVLKVAAKQKILLFCSFTNISMAMIGVCCLGFYYNLACHQLIPGEVAWKAIFGTSLIAVTVYAGFKIRGWLTHIPLFSSEGNALDPAERGIYFMLLTILGCSSLAVLINMAIFHDDVVFFPRTIKSCVAFEWYFVLMTIFVSSTRNFQVRNSEVFLAVSFILFSLYLA